MEERLKTYLRPGEQVRWQGRPAPFSLLEAEAKKQILLKWGLTVALGGGLLAVYLSRTEAPSMGFIGLVLLVAAVILISPVAERRNLMGEQYWITNQRAILMTRDKTFFYMELSDIDDLQVVGGTTKGKSLVLGRCLFEEAKKLLRWRACHPKVDVQSHDETDRALGMIFYGVQGAEAAAELLRQGRDGEEPDRLQPAAHPAIQLNLERNTLYRGDLLPAVQRFFIIKSKEMPGGVQLLAGRRLLSND